jgi:hypothetical protein
VAAGHDDDDGDDDNDDDEDDDDDGAQSTLICIAARCSLRVFFLLQNRNRHVVARG